MKRLFSRLAMLASAGIAVIALIAGFAYAGPETTDEVPVKALAGAPTDAGEIPPLVRKAIGGPGAQQVKADVDGIRRVDPAGTRAAVYITTAADGGACIALSSGAAACGSAESIRTGKFGLTTIDPPAGKPAVEPIGAGPDGSVITRPVPGGKMIRYGIVADDVQQVAAHSPNGISSTPVRGNVYAIDLGHEGLSDSARAVDLIASDGTATRYSLQR